MSLEAIRQLVTTELNAVNQLILRNMSSDVGLVDELSHHIVENGGKRLRPILVLLSANAFGYEGDHHISLAAAIEYFHTATLLHDDVVDESLLRRGVDTANQIWGSKASILVGDYLLTKSIQLVVDTRELDILSIIVACANQITCGETKQLSNKNKTALSQSDYFDVIRSKTALLFQTSSEIGAHLGRQDTKHINAMRDYGLHLGNAFQIIDDALDYDADSKTMGKSTGDDLKDGKMTLPLIYALERATDTEKAFIKNSIKEGKGENLAQIQSILKKTDALKQTYQTAQEEIDKGLTAIHMLPETPYKEALINLAHFSLKRKS